MTNVLANLIMVPFLGIPGAALATLLSYIEALALILVLGRKYSEDFPVFPWDFLARSIASSLAMLGLIRILQWHSWSLLQGLLLYILLGAAGYFLVMKLIGGLRREEVDFVRDLLMGKR